MKNCPEYQQLVECRGISLRALGISDVALNREDALIAIELLRTSAIPIFGGDVYFQRPHTIGLAYANWHSEAKPNESHSQFAERSCSEAKQYITNYPASDLIPAFALVLGT